MIDKNLQRFIDDIQSDFFDTDTNLEDSGTYHYLGLFTKTLLTLSL